MMATSGHLWAVGYEDIGRASEVRETIVSLGLARTTMSRSR